MDCIKCGYETKVLDSRLKYTKDGNMYKRRRRECIRCGCRFTTKEVVVPDKTLAYMYEVDINEK